MMPAVPSPESRVPSPGSFGRVAVLLGGTSSEREVSLDSGAAVLAALTRAGVDAFAVDGIPALIESLQRGKFERVFNILHGQHGGGEDGVLQGLLDAFGVPYTGSGVLGSALSMDKARSKQVWQALGLPTPPFVALAHAADLHPAALELGFPLVVKPACEGSSVGISRVFEESGLAAAAVLAARYPGPLLVERLIEGDEFTVGIVADALLPSIQIVPAGAYYDYHAKYLAEDTRYLCPGLTGADEDALLALARSAFDALACSGWGRVDLMRDQDGRFWLLEVNTAPGMTSHSLVPKAAQAAAIDFDEICMRILGSSLECEQSGLAAAFKPQPHPAEGGL